MFSVTCRMKTLGTSELRMSKGIVKLNVGVIGDFDPAFKPHPATNEALKHAADKQSLSLNITWLPTQSLTNLSVLESLEEFDGFLISPGSPYESMQGALNAIEFARKFQHPILGTCGGFQHIVIEYARNVLNFTDADHAEYNSYASDLFISKVACSLVGQFLDIEVRKNSRAFQIYKEKFIKEHYYCNFGLNPSYQDLLDKAGLRIVGVDENNEARILEMADHPFFMATLFVPQLSSHPHPVLICFSRSNGGQCRSIPNLTDAKQGQGAVKLKFVLDNPAAEKESAVGRMLQSASTVAMSPIDSDIFAVQQTASSSQGQRQIGNRVT